MTLLHDSVENRNFELTELLVSKGANVNLQTAEGMLPINVAALDGDVKTVSFLIQNGSLVDFPDNYGVTPLHKAVHNSHFEVSKLLISNGADVNAVTIGLRSTPLHLAVMKGNLPIVELLALLGADLNKKNSDGIAPIHLAVLNGNYEMVYLLIKRGSLIDLQDNNGDTALHLAIKINNLSIVELLASKGADLNKKNTDEIEMTPVSLAIILNDLNILDLLLKYKPNINENDYYPPIFFAALKGCVNMIDLLIKNGADLNIICSIEGEIITASHIAVLEDQIPVFEMLVKNGVDITVRDHEGKTPADYLLNVNLRDKYKKLEETYIKTKPILKKILSDITSISEEEINYLEDLGEKESVGESLKNLLKYEIRKSIISGSTDVINKIHNFFDHHKNIISKEELLDIINQEKLLISQSYHLNSMDDECDLSDINPDSDILLESAAAAPGAAAAGVGVVAVGVAAASGVGIEVLEDSYDNHEVTLAGEG